ncbi:hypothetical protein D910_08653 [Dendroctonus ponderosae]
MRKKLKYFLTLLWFAYLIVSSILLFKKGFLLSKEVQNQNATCDSLELDELTACFAANYKNSASCPFDANWREKLYSKANSLCIPSDTKVILLIVDALRYDFAVFNEDNLKPLPYENRLPAIKRTLDKFPASSRLYKFIADPPTTTMQRIKALTTGSLPTFIDAGSNFASSQITEDNIIDQVLKTKENIVFMGDDTWTSLYPNRFIRNFPYPSFDVWDLDTVDNGVRANLFPELEKRDWKMLIGHFLGVDHCGHRHGPNHPEMVRKLTEINGVIEDVIKVMDNETILFVIGDHGGATEDEVSSAMFVYSKQTLLSIGEHKSSVKQVDLVPTLSAILGVPVPFQNLGVLIHNALPEPQNTDKLRWKLPLFWLWHNARQMVSYMQTYSENSKIFDEHYLELYYSEIESLQAKLDSVTSDQEFAKLSETVGSLLVKLRTLCEEVWVQFDAYSISNGLTFLFLTVFFMFIISDGIPLRHLPAAIEGSFVVVCVIGLLFSVTAVAALDFSDLVDSSLYTCLFLTNVLSHLMFLLPVFQNWTLISFNWYQKNQANGVMHVICRLVLVCNIAGVFSNSYVLEEASALLFLLVTVLILSLLLLVRSDYGKNWVKLAIIACSVLFLLRFSVHFWRCRTEQEWCFRSPHEEVSRIKSQASKTQWGVSVVSLSLLAILVKIWLRKCGNLSGFSITEILNKLLPSVIVVCIAGYWVMQRLAGNTKSIARTSNYLAWSVYGLCGFSLIVAIIRPICVHVISAASSENLASITGLFAMLRASFLSGAKEESRRDDVPIVSGLGTAYSAVYVILATYLLLLTALVLGDLFAFSLVVMVAVGAFFLVATSVWRIKEAKTWEDLLNVPTLVVLGWILLPQYFFYASGHQPAFSNIAWESAFVGTSGLVSANNYILGALVLLNTFGTYMLAGVLLPLLIIVPFTLCVMMPSACSKNKVLHPSAQKGELFLFEQDRISTAALFSLCCKYMVGHTVKVFASMLAATIHCRHLMVWSIFAPKFIFEAIALFITLGSVLVGYLVFIRINFQIERLVTKLNKTH